MTTIRVSTGSRLHFGLFDPTGERSGGRKFGGLGMMVEYEPIEVELYPDANQNRVSLNGHPEPVLVASAREFVERAIERLGLKIGGELRVLRCPPEHSGLGTGTQLGVAIAAACAWADGLDPGAEELAQISGRGLRSSIGVHGFVHGGFLVDDGKAPHEPLSPLAARSDVPEAWRVVLIRPSDERGLSGEAERSSFAELTAPPQADVDRLRELAESVILPAVQSNDFDAFAEGIFEFGTLAGAPFRSSQGGVFASEKAREIVDHLRNSGTRGVGQSSWGPMLYAFARDDDEARQVLRALEAGSDTIRGYSARTTKPRNRPADRAKDG